MNADELLTDFIRSQVIDLGTGGFVISDAALSKIFDYIADKVNSIASESAYYSLFRLAFERVQIDPSTGRLRLGDYGDSCNNPQSPTELAPWPASPESSSPRLR